VRNLIISTTFIMVECIASIFGQDCVFKSPSMCTEVEDAKN